MQDKPEDLKPFAEEQNAPPRSSVLAQKSAAVLAGLADPSKLPRLRPRRNARYRNVPLAEQVARINAAQIKRERRAEKRRLIRERNEKV